jgi:phospholipase/carboxylesterase
MNEPRFVEVPGKGVIYRFRHRPQEDGPAVMMLHGFGGDENSMWILESTLPSLPLVVSVRGTHSQPIGDFAWTTYRGGLRACFRDFREAFDAIKTVERDAQQRIPSAPARWVLMGFSQGAAIAFSLAACGAMRPAGIIALAGFLPEGDLSKLAGIPIYWGHGSRDEFVPVQRAEKDVQRLSSVNNDVEFCQADVGHKLGVECARGLKEWFSRHFS